MRQGDADRGRAHRIPVPEFISNKASNFMEIKIEFHQNSNSYFQQNHFL